MKPIALLIVVAPLLSIAQAAWAVDFNRDRTSRPIFAANCLKCHGIDDAARKSKLRLDDRGTATAPAKSGRIAIVPGKPASPASSSGESLPRMSTSGCRRHRRTLTLTDSQKNVLRQWIAEGAKYQTHWAFVAPRQAALPAVRQGDWPRRRDRSFRAGQPRIAGSLHPSPPKPTATRWCGWLYLDLIGIPSANAAGGGCSFVERSRLPDACEHLVDQLLASPRYGERWARRWLDIARYADTNGFEKDRHALIWPYRDWVINALNADMPFDEFTIEQLAGDMLPNATAAQKIATGFHRNTMLNEEGGIDPLEYRFYASIDRINTTGTAWLGLTVGCAQCHTHKFDPITHAEYYQLMAFLDNADEPQLEVPDRATDQRREQIERKIATLTSELPEKWPVEDVVKWRRPQVTVTTMGDLEFETDGEAVDRIRLELTEFKSKTPPDFGHIAVNVAPRIEGSIPSPGIRGG